MEKKNKLEAVKEKYGVSFQSKRPSYEKLALNIKLNLEALLKENSIDFMEVNYRIKESDSFYEKICRKEKEKSIVINNPFEEIKDICGVRIICYYITDLKEIDTIIGENFKVIEREYKANNLKENEFGYLSNHYVVKLKEEWLKLPIIKGLEDYTAEIQVRTILMHAWADISHKLNYKQANTDKPLARKLNQLSALFEIADSHFIALKSASQEKYTKEMKKSKIPDEYNIDLMRAIFKEYIKIENIKKVSDEEIGSLIKLLKGENISPIKLISYFKIIDENDIEIVGKEFESNGIRTKENITCYSYTTITLAIMNDSFYKEVSEYHDFTKCIEFKRIREKYKNQISNGIEE